MEPSSPSRPLPELWEDFLHYVKVARADVARSFGQAILDSGADPSELYRLSVETPESGAVLARATRLEGISDIVVGLRKMIEVGHDAERQDPQRIVKSIEMLGGTFRGAEIAARRLAMSGEYALPQLLQKLSDPRTPTAIRNAILAVLPRIGKDAVRPLSVALQTSDPSLQEVIANALGAIEYPHAAARLKERAACSDVLPRVKQAAERALVACGGSAALGQTTAALYYDQALSYYYQRESVAPDVRYKTANVWYWDEDRGLTYRVVPREIFCDIYAMRMARLALQHDADFYPAVSLWIAANLKRAADMTEDMTDPTYGETTPSEAYFALASGAKYLQDVLARALGDNDSAVALGAIEALAQTSGAENLVEPVTGGAQSLVQALSCPDRTVRFLAAVSLANALPTKRFTGHELVMAQLVEALRQTGQRTALLIVEDIEQRNALKAAIRAVGYDVIDEPDPDSAIAAAHASSGVDVAVLALWPSAAGVIVKFREDPALLMLPAVVAGKTEALKVLAETDSRVVLMENEIDEPAVAQALEQAAQRAAGGAMTPDVAVQWTIRSANAIQQLGQTGNVVFDITRAEGALIAALDHEQQAVQLAASKALAVMRTAGAQRAIAAVAIDAQNPEDFRIATFKDLSSSLRRYGNQLTEELADAVLKVVEGQDSQELLNAAAQALGAMDLPSEQIKPLILQTSH